MKKLITVCLILLSVNAFSKDVLSQVQGKWKMDLAATKAQPEVKKQLEDKKNPMLPMMLGMLSSAVFEFKKDSLGTTLQGKTSEEKFTVIKNTAKLLVIENGKKEKLYIIPKGKTIVLRDSEEGKPPKEMPPMILKKAGK